MGDVAAVHIGSGKIIVTRMDGSKWDTGIGFGNERSESGKKVGTRFCDDIKIIVIGRLI